MTEHGPDWSAYQRLDDAAIIDFLTSTAGVLTDHGIISSKDTDNLRLVLSGLNPGAGGRTLILAIKRERAEYLELLLARFGINGLCLNILRFTIRNCLMATTASLGQIGQALLKRAELLFNRPFLLQSDGHPERQVLFSALIVDFVSSIANTCQVIGDELGNLARMAPCDLPLSTAKDEEIDRDIAAALGFASIDQHCLPGYITEDSKRKIAQALVAMADNAMQFAEQLIWNTSEEAAHDLISAGELLKLESQRLAAMDLPRGESLVIWEVRRRHIIECIVGLNQTIDLVGNSLVAALGVEITRPTQLVTESGKRRLIFDLMASGLPSKRAKLAVSDLLSYLSNNALRPEQVLPAELNRINPDLTSSSLNTLGILFNDSSLMTLAASEKKTTLIRASGLAKIFGNISPTAVVAMLFLILSGGCGLKTAPQSTVSELRPDIPFHITEPSKAVDESRRGQETQAAPQLKAGEGGDGNVERKSF